MTGQVGCRSFYLLLRVERRYVNGFIHFVTLSC